MSSAKETAKSSGTPFSEKELALIAACVEFGSLENVDFNKVAERAGYKDAKNAKVMWSRLKTNKLGVKGNAKSDGDGTSSSTPKTPTKARANRVTKSKKTPSKAQVKAEQSDDEEQHSEEPKEEATAVKDEEGQDE
ncbi:MAG: hypothetical protein M1836_003051 [Candelina mexicana]|nr:MAG: hypothetical protein M1836_003051 [Candelina mexicana]